MQIQMKRSVLARPDSFVKRSILPILGAAVFLCAGVPDWVYVDPAHPEATFSHFSFIEGLTSDARRRSGIVNQLEILVSMNGREILVT